MGFYIKNPYVNNIKKIFSIQSCIFRWINQTQFFKKNYNFLGEICFSNVCIMSSKSISMVSVDPIQIITNLLRQLLVIPDFK